MKTLLGSAILSLLLCASPAVHSHETKTIARADAAKARDEKSSTTIEGTVRAVDLAKRTIVVVTATGQEYVLPYVDEAKAPVTVGQKVTIVIHLCIGRKNCIDITIIL